MKFIIIGAGQTGRLVAEIVTRIPGLECVGYLDRDPAHQGKNYLGLPVLGSDEDLERFRDVAEGALPVIGDLTARLRLFQRCKTLGFEIVSVVDPSVVAASDLRMGLGAFISFNTSILTGVELGDYAFVGTGVNILHDTIIGSNCVIGGGTTIGASVTVGDNVAFGTGVTVASRKLRIGNSVQVAAGSVILKDVPDNAFVLGNPARVIGRSPTIVQKEPFATALGRNARETGGSETASVFAEILGRTDGLDRPAVTGHQSHSHGELLRAAERLAEQLRQQGLEGGGRVAVCLDQGLEYMASLLAVRRAGGISVLMAPDWTDGEKKRVMEHSEVRWAVADTPVLFDRDPDACRAVDSLDCMVHEYRVAQTTAAEPDDAVLIYTSGTTGTPKGVILTESCISANVRAVAEYLEMTARDASPVFTPTCYAYSLSQNLVHMLAGGAILPMPSGLMFPAELLQNIARFGLTGLSGTPTAYRIVSQLDVASSLDLATVRYVMSGGQPLDIRLVDQLASMFPRSRVVNMYGCTENSPRISYHFCEQQAGMDENGFFAVGRSVRGTKIRVAGADGAESAAGEVGEVAVRGTSLMRGYWRDEKATADRMKDGWFHTRDLGYTDREGRLHLVGRESTIINIGNEKVSPEEVERVLLTHSGVVKAAVYGAPDTLLGESVEAMVVLEGGASTPVSDLQRHCRGRISGYKIPRKIHVVDAIPETLYGKIDRKRIRETQGGWK